MKAKNCRLASVTDLKNKIKKSSFNCTITDQGLGNYYPIDAHNFPTNRKVS